MPKHSNHSDPNTETQRHRSPSLLHRFGSFDLFNRLLFNREAVYHDLRRSSPVRASDREETADKDQGTDGEDCVVQSVDFKEEEEGVPLQTVPLQRTPTNMAVNKGQGRPPKKGQARVTRSIRSEVTVTKKRSASATNKNKRASKMQKMVPKANSGKRVNGRGDSITNAFVISDTEDNHDPLRVPTESLTPPRHKFEIDYPDSEDDEKPTFVATPTPIPTHSTNLTNELVRLRVSHAREIECLRLQLGASQANLTRAKEDVIQQVLDLQRRHVISNDKQMADCEDELATEKLHSYELSWECTHLRREMEEASSRLQGEQGLIQQRDEFERLYKEEQTTNANLLHELEDKDSDSTRKATELATEMLQLANQIEALQREVSDLKADNAALRISASSTPSPRSDSPAHSLSSAQSDADIRLANIRKTYITVKRRYDNLHSIAANISTVTQSWDHGSFGEFGSYLRQLKTALDENGPVEGKTSASQVTKVE